MTAHALLILFIWLYCYLKTNFILFTFIGDVLVCKGKVLMTWFDTLIHVQTKSSYLGALTLVVKMTYSYIRIRVKGNCFTSNKLDS